MFTYYFIFWKGCDHIYFTPLLICEHESSRETIILSWPSRRACPCNKPQIIVNDLRFMNHAHGSQASGHHLDSATGKSFRVILLPWKKDIISSERFLPLPSSEHLIRFKHSKICIPWYFDTSSGMDESMRPICIFKDDIKVKMCNFKYPPLFSCILLFYEICESGQKSDTALAR